MGLEKRVWDRHRTFGFYSLSLKDKKRKGSSLKGKASGTFCREQCSYVILMAAEEDRAHLHPH
jgi:transcriptional antiterminator Rof (Rho-off)